MIELPQDAALEVETGNSISATIEPVLQQDLLTSSLHLCSFDKTTVINISIMVLVIVLVAFQVLSVNTGYSRGWTPEEIAYRVPIGNWRGYNDVLNMAPESNNLSYHLQYW